MFLFFQTLKSIMYKVDIKHKIINSRLLSFMYLYIKVLQRQTASQVHSQFSES